MSVDLNAPEVKTAIDEAVSKLLGERLEKETAGLKQSRDDLLKEKKTLEERYKDVDPEEYRKLKSTKRDADDKNADPAELRKRIEDEITPKLTKAEQERDEALKKLSDRVIDADLTNALVDNGVAKDFLPAAKALLLTSRKVEATDGGANVDGKAATEFVKSWVAGDGKQFVAAPANAGGGANGSGGAGGKKLSEMTSSEKIAFIKEHGETAWNDKIKSES